LSERGLKGAAIETLTAEADEKGAVPTSRAERWTKLDEASRALLRGLYLDTKRNALVQALDAAVKPVKNSDAPKG
jgi:hypothetical protein